MSETELGSADASPFADDLLRTYVEIADRDEGQPIELLLLVGGRIVRGTLIGRAAYCRGLAEAARSASHAETVMTHATRQRVRAGAASAPVYIHLRDVAVMGALGGAPLLGALIRIRLDRVDGWMYGSPAMGTR